MMEQTKIFKALQGVRGRPPVDLVALEQLLVRFGQLVVEQRWIKEIDINPLLATPALARDPKQVASEGETGGLIALDARVVLHEKSVTQDQLPRLAVRAYPSRYISTMTTQDGSLITFRPIRPEDEPMMVKFHETLSDRSVYLRYFHPLMLNARVAHDRLARICFIDYDREIALVAQGVDPRTNESRIMAVGRLSRIHGTDDAELTMLVNDQFQGRGLGREMIQRLLKIGRAEKMHRVLATILADNIVMRELCEKLGFTFAPSPHEGRILAEMVLD